MVLDWDAILGNGECSTDYCISETLGTYPLLFWPPNPEVCTASPNLRLSLVGDALPFIFVLAVREVKMFGGSSYDSLSERMRDFWSICEI